VFRGKIVLDENFANSCLKCPRNHFPKKHVFGPNFLQNCSFTYFWDQTDYVVRLGQNCFARKLCYFLPKTPPKSFFQNICLRSIFSYEIAPSPIFGAKLDYVARWGQNCSGRKLCYFLPKMPLKLFFPKNTFSVHIFFMKSLPHLFLGPNGRVSGQNCFGRKIRYFCLKRPQNRFSKKHVFGPFFFNFIYLFFLMKSHPHLFSGLNKLCEAFRGKIVLEENFATFCLKRLRNCFSKKHISRPIFFTKPLLHLFSGPNKLCGAFGAKLFCTKTLLHFA
jgi:hypothetical protein